jgi:two-component system sporulation sensor kinase B
MLQIIEDDVKYSDKIVNDLLDYSREMRLELTEITPKSIMKDTLSLVDIPTNIKTTDLTENDSKIKVDVEKMKRAFVNIIKNAIDAMPEGGTLTIRSKKSNGNVEFVFSDTGVGMSEETLGKLWTPLFTTKARGMGFGLAICKRVIEAHEGKVTVESAIGKGTTFKILIPIKPEQEGGEKVWVKQPESLLLTTTKA